MNTIFDLMHEAPKKGNEKVKDKTFGNVVFGDPKDRPYLAKIQNAKPGSEKDTEKEKNLYNALEKWVDSRAKGIGGLKKNIELIKLGAQKYPKVFSPDKPNGTIVYRGISNLSTDIIDNLKKTSLQNWSKSNRNYWMYKNPIEYNPRSEIQSWTYSTKIGWKFGGNAILLTKQNSEFYFNSQVIAAFFGTFEDEILHYGTSFSEEVYIGVDDKLFVKRILPAIKKNKQKKGND